MKYLSPKNIDVENIDIIEIKDKYIIKNKDLVNIYGVIIKLNEFLLIKEYNKFKIVLQDKNPLEKYENLLNEKINNYKNIVKNNEIYINHSNKLNNYYKNKPNELFINIHYVKKSGFLNIPKISIL